MTDIISLLMTYQSELADQAEAAALIFLRVGAVFATLPAFGEQSVPARIRLVLVIMFGAAIAPAVLPDLQGVSLAQGFLPEVAIGLTLGIVVRLFILSLMTAGTMAANATSLSQLFPMGAEAQPAIAKLFVVAGLAIAVQTGLHLRVVDYLILSYDLLPAGSWPRSDLIADWGVAQISRAFSLAFMISMPFLIASLVYNVALGVINRAMPQLMVSFVGAPALGLGGLVLLALVTPVALTVWLQAFTSFLAAPIGAIQ